MQASIYKVKFLLFGIFTVLFWPACQPTSETHKNDSTAVKTPTALNDSTQGAMEENTVVVQVFEGLLNNTKKLAMEWKDSAGQVSGRYVFLGEITEFTFSGTRKSLDPKESPVIELNESMNGKKVATWSGSFGADGTYAGFRTTEDTRKKQPFSVQLTNNNFAQASKVKLNVAGRYIYKAGEDNGEIILEVKEKGNGSISFFLDIVGPAPYFSTGKASGEATLDAKGRYVFSMPESKACSMHFTFTKQSVNIVQKGNASQCLFGEGVNATGTLVKM
jgi:hypothetical protein